MGDRGNVFFVDQVSGKQLAGIYMYTHWAGSSLPWLVQAALLRGKGRWGDSQYLARIVFSELIQDSVMEETGYGLSTRIGDNEHAIVRVDDTKQRVSFHAAGQERNPKDKGLASWSYEEYLAADKAAFSVFAPEMLDDEDEDVVEVPQAKAKPTKKKPAAKKKPGKKPAAKAKSKRAKR